MAEKERSAVAARIGRVPLQGEAMTKDVYKPLMFGNHQRLFKVFTAVFSSGRVSSTVTLCVAVCMTPWHAPTHSI